MMGAQIHFFSFKCYIKIDNLHEELAARIYKNDFFYSLYQNSLRTARNAPNKTFHFSHMGKLISFGNEIIIKKNSRASYMRRQLIIYENVYAYSGEVQ